MEDPAHCWGGVTRKPIGADRLAGLPSALLVYAAADSADEDAGAVYRLEDGRCVEQVVLDLRGETTELLDRVKALAAKVREHRARSHPASRAA